MGNIKTRFLSPDTTYAAFLVFKLVEEAQGLETANAAVRFVEDEQGEHVEQEEVQPTVVHFQSVKNTNEKFPVQRNDGWMDGGGYGKLQFFKMDMKERWRHDCGIIQQPGR